MRPLSRRASTVAISALALLVFVSVTAVGPSAYCARGAADFYQAPSPSSEALARNVAHTVATLSPSTFATGSQRFDGEWWFGTYMMAGMGLGQTAEQQPDAEWAFDSMQMCIEGLLSRDVRNFDRAAWNEDAIDTLDGSNGHAAYLGYTNLVLSYHRSLVAHSKYAELNDHVTEALARRLEQSEIGMLETYPGETYPVDNAAAVASIALRDRAAGLPLRPVVTDWLARLKRFRAPDSGLLYQSVREDGSALDGARGSGTALAAYFLSFADPALSRSLYDALRQELYQEVLGFGVVHEYPLTHTGGRGDIDSGPIVLGYGVSATGFALAGARTFQDERAFARLYATAHLFGAPREDGTRTAFLSGGPLGNAILLAMLTAPVSAPLTTKEVVE